MQKCNCLNLSNYLASCSKDKKVQPSKTVQHSLKTLSLCFSMVETSSFIFAIMINFLIHDNYLISFKKIFRLPFLEQINRSNFEESTGTPWSR